MFSYKFQKAVGEFFYSGIDIVECIACIDGVAQIRTRLKAIEFGIYQWMQ
jgi:hypothetical protein